MEKVISFKNDKGQNLFGIIHIPKKNIFATERIGINLLNPGIKYRVAPNRLNIKIARNLCKLGFYVLRFDASGIGDSEGEFEDGILVADIWEDVQSGRLVGDTLAANDIFRKDYKLDQLFMIGNCGGAITSLLTTVKDEKVEGLCLIDVPINMRTATTSKAEKITGEGEKSRMLLSGYIQRIFKLNSWYRFFTFKTDYRVLWKVLNGRLKQIFSKKRKNYKEAEFSEQYCRSHNLNPFFIESIRKFVKQKKPVLFILAGNDAGTEVFNKYIESICPTNIYGELVTTCCIRNANHVYTLIEWQELLIDKINNWLRDHIIIKNR